jgi:hypothetical protein
LILTVQLDGQDLTEVALFQTEIRKDSTDAISTASLFFKGNPYRDGVYDVGEYDQAYYAFDVEEMAEVVLTDQNGDRQFAGYVTAIDQKTESGAITEYACTCSDYGLILDRYIVNETYTNQTDQDMIMDALAGIPGITVAEANLTLQVADMGTFEAKDITAREFLERVCELSGGSWRVDYYGVLQYYKAGVHAAPFALSDTPNGTTSFGHLIESFQRDFSAAANRITVLGGLTTGGAEVAVTANDTASQAEYGILSATVVDRNIADSASATLRANAEISQRAWPRVAGEATTWKDGLDVGQTLTVTNSAFGLNGGYLVKGITVTFVRKTEYDRGDGQEYTSEYRVFFGHRISDWVAALRRVEQRPRQSPTVPIGNVPPASIGPGNFANSIEPVNVVDALPVLPDVNYSANAVVLLTTDRKLYRRSGNTWTAAVPTIDLTGQITETQISDNSISSPKIQALAVVAGKIAANAVEAGNLAADSVIAGTVAAGAIRAIDAAFTSAAIQSADINTLSASKLTAGTIDATLINVININATNVTSGGFTGRTLTLNLNNVTTTVSNTSVGGLIAGIRVESNLTTAESYMAPAFVGSVFGLAYATLDVTGGQGRVIVANSSGSPRVLMDATDSTVKITNSFGVAEKVLAARGGAVSDPSGGTVIDTQARTAISLILVAMRASTGHGLIAG